jgi:glutathione S-transferase
MMEELMKLYYSPGTCSLASHIALNEAGIKFRVEKVDLRNKQCAEGDYKKINAKGYVPALQLDNGEILTEGAIILQYIADQAPNSHLLPKAGTWERYRALEWLNYVATEIHKGFSILWAADRWVPSKEGNEQVKAAAKEAMANRFNFLNEKLSHANYLMGEQFSVADGYLFTVMKWTTHLQIDLQRWPALTQFMERVAARPKVAEVLMAEGLK